MATKKYKVESDVKVFDEHISILDPELREEQMISLAMDRAEERLRKGTATSQEIVYFLKLGCQKEKQERDKLNEEIKLLKAKTAAYENQKDLSSIYSNAINAMMLYGGKTQHMEEEDSEDIF